MIAYVSERGKKGPPTITIKVDSKAVQVFLAKDQEIKTQQNFKVVCYLIESLSTSVREYRTLRMAEFLGGFTSVIMNPIASLKQLSFNHA